MTQARCSGVNDGVVLLVPSISDHPLLFASTSTTSYLFALAFRSTLPPGHAPWHSGLSRPNGRIPKARHPPWMDLISPKLYIPWYLAYLGHPRNFQRACMPILCRLE